MRFFRRGQRNDDVLPVDAEAAEASEADAPEVTEQAEAVEGVEAADDVETVEAGDNVVAVDAAEPAEPAEAVNDQPVEPVEPVEAAEADEPGGEAVESAPFATDGVEAAEPAEPAALDQVSAELTGGDPDVEPGDLEKTGADEDALSRAEAAADIALRPAEDEEPIETEDEADVQAEPVQFAEPSRPQVDFGPATDFVPEDDPAAGGRPPALRFAALHLRAGQHALARAELEALAGRGRLDEPALLDLAEVRWRTGDLAGAGDAANALLARGSESPLALVIAAEAVAAVGRPGEARRLSSRALELADGPLDPLFAGMPRSSFWPDVPGAEPAAEAPRRRGRNRAGDTSGAPSTASEAFAGGRAALARGDSTRAALLLGVAMRLAPEFAEDVLHAVTGRDDQPLLALVRGDALRLLGREAEALEAFDRARGRASAAGSASPSGRGTPGLFDDDPAMSGDEED